MAPDGIQIKTVKTAAKIIVPHWIISTKRFRQPYILEKS